ncbi:MAG: hypothetical protein QGD89_03000 [Actinomycetota bacterium]|nr:hypothetical protein [Actinomycetota bacterium]
MTVDRSDLEAKLLEIEGVLTDVEDEARSSGGRIAVVAVAVVIGLMVFAAWRSRRSGIRVEVYKQ